jgi:hypothetical protein
MVRCVLGAQGAVLWFTALAVVAAQGQFSDAYSESWDLRLHRRSRFLTVFTRPAASLGGPSRRGRVLW